MRDYAKFKPGFWTGDFGDEIRGNPWAQALGAYLITNSHANMIGLYRLPFSYMLEDLGWKQAKLDRAMVELIEAGFCKYDRDYRCVWVCELARHEWGNEPNIKDLRVRSLARAAKKIINGLWRSGLVALFYQRYLPGWEPILSPCKALRKPLPSPTEVGLEALGKQEQEQEQDQESDQEQEQDQEGEPAAGAAGFSSEAPPRDGGRPADLSFDAALLKAIPEFQEMWRYSMSKRDGISPGSQQLQIDKFAKFCAEHGAAATIAVLDDANLGSYKKPVFKAPGEGGGNNRPSGPRGGSFPAAPNSSGKDRGIDI